MTAPARFRQEDVKRAVAGCLAGGADIARVEIKPSGSIVIEVGRTASVHAHKNPWDGELEK